MLGYTWKAVHQCVSWIFKGLSGPYISFQRVLLDFQGLRTRGPFLFETLPAFLVPMDLHSYGSSYHVRLNPFLLSAWHGLEYVTKGGTNNLQNKKPPPPPLNGKCGKFVIEMNPNQKLAWFVFYLKITLKYLFGKKYASYSKLSKELNNSIENL